MKKFARTVCLTLVAVIAFGAVGCKTGGRKNRTDHPKTEHPKGEHPKGDHPKTEHPKGEHPKGDHPKH